MIWILTPNPALDVTYELPTVDVGGVYRPQQMRVMPGGKGVNVARVLASLGRRNIVTGFLGGSSGSELRQLLTDLSPCDEKGNSLITQRWIDVPTQTRRTTALVTPDGEVTMINEVGIAVEQDRWNALRDQLDEGIEAHDVLVISGSFPSGAPEDILDDLIGGAHERGALTLVDTSGPLLVRAAACGADLLKPNHHELAEATGEATVRDGARHLLALGARAVFVSQGREGATLVTADRVEETGTVKAQGLRSWRAQAPVVSGNPTGAGDAAVAALSAALADGGISALSRRLGDVVALSAAAVLAPVAGEVDCFAYDSVRTAIAVEEIF